MVPIIQWASQPAIVRYPVVPHGAPSSAFILTCALTPRLIRNPLVKTDQVLDRVDPGWLVAVVHFDSVVDGVHSPILSKPPAGVKEKECSTVGVEQGRVGQDFWEKNFSRVTAGFSGAGAGGRGAGRGGGGLSAPALPGCTPRHARRLHAAGTHPARDRAQVHDWILPGFGGNRSGATIISPQTQPLVGI